MSAAAEHRKLSVADYLAAEAAADWPSEFCDGRMWPRAESSREHNNLLRNLLGELSVALDGGPCRLLAARQRVLVARTGLWCYPDLLVVCGEPQYAPADRDTLTNPRVVVEILAESTERYDRTTKFRHYQALPSVQEYVLVAQDEPLVEQYVRQPDGRWGRTDTVGLDAALALATVPASVPLADVYRGVEFPPPARPAAQAP